MPSIPKKVIDVEQEPERQSKKANGVKMIQDNRSQI
jgi:hypothetical protein